MPQTGMKTIHFNIVRVYMSPSIRKAYMYAEDSRLYCCLSVVLIPQTFRLLYNF